MPDDILGLLCEFESEVTGCIAILIELVQVLGHVSNRMIYPGQLIRTP